MFCREGTVFPPHRKERCQAAPATPSSGKGPTPKIRQGESGTRRMTPAQITMAGTDMLPVPRITLPARSSARAKHCGEDNVGITERGLQFAACPTQSPVQRRSEQDMTIERKAPSATWTTTAWNPARRLHRGARPPTPAPPRKMPPPWLRRNPSVRHDHGKHQRHASQRVGAET